MSLTFRQKSLRDKQIAQLLAKAGSSSQYVLFEEGDSYSNSLRRMDLECNVLKFSLSDMANITATRNQVVVVVSNDKDIKSKIDEPFARAVYLIEPKKRNIVEVAPLRKIDETPVALHSIVNKPKSRSCETCVMGCCYVNGRKRMKTVNGEKLFLDPYNDEYVPLNVLRGRREARAIEIEERLFTPRSMDPSRF